MDPFKGSADRREREWEAEIRKGFRSNVSAVIAAHCGVYLGLRSIPSGRASKVPTFGNWQQRASSDPAKHAFWNRRYDRPDFLVRTGRDCGLWILDVDGPRGRARLAELEKQYGPLPDTVSVGTGRDGGGIHLWFKPTPEGPDLKTVGKAMIAGKRAPLDLKGRGGFAVLPGSEHLTRRRYRFLPGRAPDECPLASFRDSWLPILDWADEKHESESNRPSARRDSPVVHREHDPASLLFGDGDYLGGFQNPAYLNAIQFFFRAGSDAPAEIIIATLREMIAEAPKDHGRNVSRYLDGPDLPRIVQRARSFVKSVKENQSECDRD